MGLREGVSPYRFARKNRLPKFPPASNPFRATTLPSGEQLDGAGSQEGQASESGPTVDGGASDQPRPTSAPSALQRMARLFVPRSRAAAMEERRPVQTELALERVKVVRNDLLDADLEVVPAKAAGQPVQRAAGRSSTAQLLAEAQGKSKVQGLDEMIAGQQVT